MSLEEQPAFLAIETSFQPRGLGNCDLYPALSKDRVFRLMGGQTNVATDRHLHSFYYQHDCNNFQVQIPVAFTPTSDVIFMAPISSVRENRKGKVKSLKMPTRTWKLV